MNEAILSSIGNQLWRYYDIDIDIHTVEFVPTNDELCITREYNIFGDTDEFRNLKLRIKCKMLEFKVEDLYWYDGASFVSPTTTLEEQEAR